MSMEPRERRVGDRSVDGQIPFDFDAPPSPEPIPADEREKLENDEVAFYIATMRESLDRAGARAHDMRRPCPNCGFTLGVLAKSGHQNTVRCAKCGNFAYNAPKTETGERARTVKTLRDRMSPSQQARILNRDHGRCLLCGSPDNLTIGHLLSIADGHAVGALESELNDDANLAAMCEGCNAGLGRRSVSTRTFVILTLRILQAEIRRSRSGRDRGDQPVQVPAELESHQ